jgi:nickel transport protein
MRLHSYFQLDTPMNKLHRITVLAMLAAAVLSAASAQAHGIWFAQRSGELALIYGEGADDLDMVKRQPLISAVTAYDASGTPVSTALEVSGLLLVDTKEKPAIVAAVLDNGTWSKTPEGKWLKKGKNEVPGALTSGHNFKYAVHLRSPLRGALPPLPGHTLQIVPIDATLPDKLGQDLRLRVLYKGKPVAGALVLNDFVNDPDAKPLESGADGTVVIKVRNQGLNVVTALLAAPPEDPVKTDKVEHLASLSFVLAHAPE